MVFDSLQNRSLILSVSVLVINTLEVSILVDKLMVLPDILGYTYDQTI